MWRGSRAGLEDGVAADRRRQQATVLVAGLAAQHRGAAVATVERGAADDVPLGSRLDVVDRDVDRRYALALVRMRPQRRAHAVVDEREAGHPREQAAAVDQLGSDRQPDG